MDEKNKIQDMNPPEKKSIRNIPLTKKQAKELEKIEKEIDETVPVSATPPTSSPRRPVVRRAAPPRAAKKIVETYEASKENKKSYKPIIISIVLLCIAIYSISHVFARATVSIVRSEETVVLSGNTFSITPALETVTTASGTSIGYKKVGFSVSASTTISATGQKTVQKKASGKIVVYNDSSASQLLIATTRFQTPEGLLFRLDKNVTVPAKKNVTVDVTADQPGEKYNIGPKSFILPGFQGTSKAKTIYGKSSASMTGGSTGVVPQTSANDLSAAKGALKDAILKQVEQKIIAGIPEGYVLVKGATSQVFSDTKQSATADAKSAVISETASITAYYFEKNSFNAAIASKSSLFGLADSSGKASVDTESLTVLIPSDADSKGVSITGTSTVKAALDQESLSRKITGLTRNEALTIIKEYPGIEAVEISIKPWWETKIPEIPDIKVIIE